MASLISRLFYQHQQFRQTPHIKPIRSSCPVCLRLIKNHPPVKIFAFKKSESWLSSCCSRHSQSKSKSMIQNSKKKPLHWNQKIWIMVEPLLEQKLPVRRNRETADNSTSAASKCKIPKSECLQIPNSQYKIPNQFCKISKHLSQRWVNQADTAGLTWTTADDS